MGDPVAGFWPPRCASLQQWGYAGGSYRCGAESGSRRLAVQGAMFGCDV
jgi:hypothetical protein